ncbi:MAG: hypothetical protein PHW52_00785 [Candidatus Pacebacteria bacterium]|nr:hypothetical protein [Candidatus Paceibacterota bacterium]
MVFNNTKDANSEKIVIPVNWQLVNYWVVDSGEEEGDLEMKIEFVNPDGVIFNSYENKISLQKNIKRFRSRTNINGFEVSKSGRYKVFVNYKKGGEYVKISELPVDINISFNIPPEGNIGLNNN